MQEKSESNVYKNLVSVLNSIENTILGSYKYKDREGFVVNIIAIKSLLEQGLKTKDTINIAKVLEALHYIETRSMAKTHVFFNEKSPQTIGSLLLRDKMQVLLQKEREQAPNLDIDSSSSPALSQEDYNILKYIHQALWDISLISCRFPLNTSLDTIKKQYPPAWVLTYPANVDGEIMTQEIGEWQALQMKLDSEEPNKAYRDFARSITIRGMRGIEKKDIDDLLAYLVDSSNHKDDEKEKMMQWLKCNGGQNNDGFMTEILYSGQLTNDEPVNMASVQSLEYNWSVNDGKIVLNCEVVASCLIKDGSFYVNDEKMNLRGSSEPPEKKKDIPLLGYQIQVELNLDENGAVIPSVTQLNAISFNNKLQPCVNEQYNLGL